jgi:SAM-dependent methyltransferase
LYQKASFDWLRLRYGLDAAARHRPLQFWALDPLRKRPNLRVLDLGAGAGANFYYYSRLLPASAKWWLVERDAELLAKLPQFIGGMRKAPAHTRLSNLIYHPLPYDFLASDCPIYRCSFDLVLANAVFDLLSVHQFRELLARFRQAWEASPPVFLFTLNLDQGVQFYPEDQTTRYWCRRYEEHMQRPQHFGRAMGATCALQMEALFREQGFKVKSAPSPWCISPLQARALHAKLDFLLGQWLILSEQMPAAGSRSKNGWLKSANRSFGNSWLYLCRIGIFWRKWRSRATGSAQFQLPSWQNPLLLTIIKIITNKN